MVSLVFHGLFHEDHPASEANYAVWTFVQLLMNAAQAKDYAETVCDLDPGLPDADTDTPFWRLSRCASLDLILQEYKKAVKRQIRRRRFIIAIDETYEPFYGKIKNLLICDI